MAGALKFFILIGLVLWGFLLLDRMHSTDSITNRVVKDWADKSDCNQFAHDVDGEASLSYGERIKQVVHGCW